MSMVMLCQGQHNVYDDYDENDENLLRRDVMLSRGEIMLIIIMMKMNLVMTMKTHWEGRLCCAKVRMMDVDDNE